MTGAMESHAPDSNDEFNARDIFGAASEIGDPGKQAEFVRICCGGNAGLRREVEELLRSFLQAGDFMELHPQDEDQ